MQRKKDKKIVIHIVNHIASDAYEQFEDELKSLMLKYNMVGRIENQYTLNSLTVS